MRTFVVRLSNDERVRFLVVGGFNTVLGYGVFALFYLLFGKQIGYIACVYLQYAISVPLAFYLHQRITFRAHGEGRVVIDFLRFCVVYLISLAFNTLALPFFVGDLRFGGATVHLVHLPPLIAQVIVIAIATIFTYFGHKLFSFRRNETAPDGPIVVAATTDATESSSDATGVSRRLRRKDDRGAVQLPERHPNS